MQLARGPRSVNAARSTHRLPLPSRAAHPPYTGHLFVGSHIDDLETAQHASPGQRGRKSFSKITLSPSRSGVFSSSVRNRFEGCSGETTDPKAGSLTHLAERFFLRISLSFR